MLLKITKIGLFDPLRNAGVPEPRHVGQLGLVVGAETFYINEEGEPQTVVDCGRNGVEAVEAVNAQMDEDEMATGDVAVVITKWTVMLRSGECIDVMDSEVELFRA